LRQINAQTFSQAAELNREGPMLVEIVNRGQIDGIFDSGKFLSAEDEVLPMSCESMCNYEDFRQRLN